MFTDPAGTVLCDARLAVTIRLVEAPEGGPHPALAPRHHPHVLRLAAPVDAVYTWVDDTDEAWQRERHRVLPDGALASDALSRSRTIDRGELRFSLRSLAMYANWFRHIWIVTSGQIPEWLNVDHPRITVVPHAAIFSDPGALPTFNSHAIESQLHHIPGLAEHFVYINDDVFFGRPVSIDTFFHGNGIAKFMSSVVAIDREAGAQAHNGAMLAARNDRALIEALWDRSPTRRMQHVPHAHRRSSLADLERRLPAEFDRVAHSRFRSTSDISVASGLGHYHSHALGLSSPGALNFRYIDIASDYAAEYYDHLLASRHADVFCVNDACSAQDEAANERVADFLQSYFPLASPFERSGS